MKFSVIKEHRDFFQQNGMIEFEELLSVNQLLQLNGFIDQALINRTGVVSEKLSRLSFDQVFLQGRDLWRENQELRQLICQPRLGEIAGELIEKKPLRLGYDQLFPSISLNPVEEKVQGSIYTQFLQQAVTLDEVSCIQGIACGLMLCLSQAQHSSSAIEKDIFPLQAGHGIFFSSTVAFNFEKIMDHEGQRYYLIVYAHGNAHYHLEPRDPHAHALKHLGYGFYDRLTDKLNPVIYR